MVSAVKVISVEMTTAMVFNEEEQAVEALYCVCLAVNDSEKKYSIGLTKNNLINKLKITIVAKRKPPIEPIRPKFKGFVALLDTVKTKNNGET